MPHQLHDQLRRRIETHAWLTRRPLLFPLIVFALVVLSVFAGAMTTERAERAAKADRLASTLGEAVRFIRQVETTHGATLRGGSLFLSQVEVTDDEFEVLAASGLYSIDVPIAEGVGWALANRGARAGTIGSVTVSFLSPNTQRNRRAIGFDMYSERTRRSAIDKAVQTGMPTATGPIVLAQEDANSTEHGLLLYSPVRDEAGALKGMFYVVYRGTTFVKAIETRLTTKPQFIGLDDVTEATPVYIEALGDRSAALRYAAGDLEFGGRKWRVTVGIEDGPVLAKSTMWILLIGLIMAALALTLARQFVNAALDERKFYQWQSDQLQVRDTLMLELNHRVKNTLANVLSIITLTRRKANDLDSFAESLAGRVRALSATHDILTAQQWSSATLESVVQAEIAPYLAPDDTRAQLTGPPISLAPNTALSLGLAVHELVTNAAKYGALSSDGGSVTIDWALADPETVRVRWIETGGPAVDQPARAGFGTNLLRKTVAHELGREVELDFAPGGLRATLYVPIRATKEFNLRKGRRKD